MAINDVELIRHTEKQDKEPKSAKLNLVDKDELKEVYGRMDQAGHLLQQGEQTCCYAQSEKSWVHDPQGIAWEAFHTVGEATTYGEGASAEPSGSACCVPLAPATEESAACCVPASSSTAGEGCC